MRSCGWALSAASAWAAVCSRACNWVIRLSSASWSACRLSGTSAVTRPLRSRLAAWRACWRARSSSWRAASACRRLPASSRYWAVMALASHCSLAWYSSRAASRRASAEAVWERMRPHRSSRQPMSTDRACRLYQLPPMGGGSRPYSDSRARSVPALASICGPAPAAVRRTLAVAARMRASASVSEGCWRRASSISWSSSAMCRARHQAPCVAASGTAAESCP